VARVHQEVGGQRALRRGQAHGDHGAAVDAARAGRVPGLARVGEDVLFRVRYLGVLGRFQGGLLLLLWEGGMSVGEWLLQRPRYPEVAHGPAAMLTHDVIQTWGWLFA
jgi:hypothetical protein